MNIYFELFTFKLRYDTDDFSVDGNIILLQYTLQCGHKPQTFSGTRVPKHGSKYPWQNITDVDI